MSAKEQITFRVDPPTKLQASNIPWGLRSSLFEAVLIKVVEFYDKQGPNAIGFILDGNWKIVEGDK